MANIQKQSTHSIQSSQSALSTESAKYENTNPLHYFLLYIGILIIFQELLAENLAKIPLILRFVKFIDEGLPPVLLILLICSRLLNRQQLINTNIDKLLLLFMTISLLSSIVNKVPLGIMLSQAIIYLKGFMTFYIFASLRFTPQLIKKYTRFFFIFSCIVLLLGLVDLAAPVQFRTFTGNSTYVQYFKNLPSVKSIFKHPAGFGWYMSFIASFCFAYYFIHNRNTYLAAAIIFLLGAFLSMRAKTIAGLTGAILLGLFLLPAKKRWHQWILLMIIPGFALILLWPYIIELFQFKITIYFTGEYASETARNALYYKGVEIARDYFPLGAGLGRYGSWMSRVAYSPLYDTYQLSMLYGLSRKIPNFINDTFWAMVLGENGFLGFLVYAALLLRFLKSLAREIKATQDVNVQVFLLGTFIMLAESMIESVAYPTYSSPPTSFFVFGTVGIAYSLCKK